VLTLSEENFDKKFDEFVQNLQNEILAKEIEDYNEYIVKLYHDPKYWGTIENDFVIKEAYRGPCGDQMTYFLQIEDNMIKKARFTTDGCGATVAAGNQTMMMIEGKSINEAEKLTAEDIDTALRGLPASHKHCAELAICTLKRAIEKYKKK